MTSETLVWRTALFWALLCAAVSMQPAHGAGVAQGPVSPPLPIEEVKTAPLPEPGPDRLYVTDLVFKHMIDGRLHLVDGASGRYLGVISTGFIGHSILSRDGSTLYVVTSFFDRATHGNRNDVVEIYDTRTLQRRGEIPLPPKLAEAILYRGALALSHDGRFLYAQNATPATSISVIDLKAEAFVSEIDAPGCWSIHAWDAAPRFSTICGDGSLLTVTLDGDGHPVSQTSSKPFFDPDADPIYVHAETDGSVRYFLSFMGNVYPVHLEGEAPTFDAAWSILDKADKARAWRPGGFEVTSLHRATNTLYVAMHNRGKEGSHKDPAKEVWAIDLAKHKRSARIPAAGAVSILVSQDAQPRLYLLDSAKASIDVRKVGPGFPRLRQIAGIGDTPLFIEHN